MTHKILKSALVPTSTSLEVAKAALASIVEKFIAELNAWHEHDLKAKAEPELGPRPQWGDFASQENHAEAFRNELAKWEVQRLARHEPYPAPTAPADIAAAVVKEVGSDGTPIFAADFEIVDDDPTAEEVLAKKKEELLAQISVAENAAIEMVQLPQGKRRAAELLHFDITNADQIRTAEIVKNLHDKAVATATSKKGSALTKEETETAKNDAMASVDMAKLLRAARDPAHTQHLEKQQNRHAKISAIHRVAALTMSDVEDLTPETIDQFVIPTFEA